MREPAAQDVSLWGFSSLLGRIINPSDGLCPRERQLDEDRPFDIYAWEPVEVIDYPALNGSEPPTPWCTGVYLHQTPSPGRYLVVIDIVTEWGFDLSKLKGSHRTVGDAANATECPVGAPRRK